MARPILEVCVASFAEARAAELCGADRIELNSALQLGGLTPSAATLNRILSGCSIEVIAMARPRAGGFCYSDDDWTTLISDVQWMIDQGVHGIAFGCLTADRRVDVARVEQVRKLVGDSQLVFHRAFDLIDDWRGALDALVKCDVDRIMTSGGAVSVPDGVQQIRSAVKYAGDRIGIIPAGGVTPCNLKEILDVTGCVEIHGTFSSADDDPGYLDGPIRFSTVDQIRSSNPRKIQKAIEALLEPSE